MKKTLKERFDEKWVEDENGCWLWTACGNGEYGGFQVNGHKKFAHRVSYELYNKKIPIGDCVLHKCDNPLCVNPEHLFLGSHNDNVQDKCNKNRQAKGVQHGRAIVTEQEVNKIREMYKTMAFTHEEIANIFCVNTSVVFRIIHRVTWKHLP